MSKKNKSEFIRGKPTSGNREQIFAAINKFFALFFIFIGLWVTTQVCATNFMYDPEKIGYPFYIIYSNKFTSGSYPVYYPWQYLSWALQYIAQSQYHHIFKQSIWPWLIISVCSIIFYTLITYFRGFKQVAENIFGTARWAKKKDLKKEGLLNNSTGIVLGQLASAKVDAKLNKKEGSVSLHLHKNSGLLTQVGITNVLLTAPTRSGKGVSTGIPTILYNDKESMVILDFKGENFEKTSGHRAKLGPVYRYSPVDLLGHSFNPLMEIPGGKDTYSYANLIADIVLTPQAGKTNSDANSEHFRKAAVAFLTGVILHILGSDYPDKSMPGVKKFLSLVNPNNPEDDSYVLHLMLNSTHCNAEIHERVVSAAGDQLKRVDKERSGVWSTTVNGLEVFDDSYVRECSRRHDFYLDEFENTTKPITLYFIMEYGHVERLSSIIRIFIMLMIRKFSAGKTSHGKRKMKIPVLLLLDEFDKLGKYNELQQSMGILAGYGLHFLLIIQSSSQLVDIYGKNNQFFAHCKNIISFAPGEIESGKIISEMIGKESIWKSSTSTSGSRYSVGLDHLNISGNEQERNLINADEVMKLPPDQFILLTQGRPPYIGKKCVYYEQTPFKERLLKPAFTDEKGALKQCLHNIARNEARKWFDMPLFTCYEKIQNIVIDTRFIDPWFTARKNKINKEKTEKEEKSENNENKKIVKANSEEAEEGLLIGL